jgi:thiol-disulfide isomerase/thioredoxin
MVAAAAPLLVVCLCAQWCGTCREYEATFHQIEAQFASSDRPPRFLWIDVEDEADFVDPIEVENFPSLMIADGDEPRFFGPLTPQPETLSRLIRAELERSGPGLAQPELRDFLRRLKSRTS